MLVRHKTNVAGRTPEFLKLCKYFSELSPQPMVAVEGPMHLVRYLNAAFAKLVGKSTEALIGRPFAEVVPEGSANGCESILDRVFLTGAAEVLADQKHAQSKLAYWTYSMWPIVGDQDFPAGVMIQITDVTGAAVFREQMTEMNQALALSGMRQHELTETEEKLNAKLIAATEAKSLFLANMSHEIRTPLGAILGYSELLRDPELSNNEKLCFIETINRNGRELTRIIDDILDLTKAEAGHLDVEKSLVSLPDLLADITSSLSIKASEKRVSLTTVSITGVPEMISTDPTRLRQVLLNIVGNAVKFTQDGEVKVTVSLVPAKVNMPQQVSFSIEDTGCGISPEGQAKLFNHFSQADSSTTRKFGGTGLGLILSRILARALGGDVTLRSSTVNRGSVFVVTISSGEAEGSALLPAVHTRKPSLTLPPANVATTLAGIRVLLAEDAADNRVLIKHVLSHSGAEVEVAHNGLEAVEKALDGHYDVALMDIQMPLLDGYGATKRLRAEGYRQPILALTAHALREEREKSRRCGFSEHLTKPIDMKRLVEQVARFARYGPWDERDSLRH